MSVAEKPQRFHTQDGIYFARSFGGWVEIHEDDTYRFSFDPATWASVVSYVSARNSAERYRCALKFHQGRDHGVCNSAYEEVHAPDTDLAAALEIAASRFQFLAEIQKQVGRPESRGNAAILERHAEDCLSAIAKARGAPPPSEEQP
jgi:hypothetical protein